MKKIVVLTALIALSFSLFAQIPDTKLDNVTEIEKTSTPFVKETDFFMGSTSSREDIKSEWFSFVGALNYYLSGTLKYYSNSIFPDSLPVRLFTDGPPAHMKWHSVGSVFDPMDELFVLYGGDRLSRRQPYTIDSIAFRYLYHKHNDDAVKDELVMQFYHTTKLKNYTWQSTPPEPFGIVEFNPTTLSGVDFNKQIKYDLEYKDTATFESGQYKWLSFAVDMPVPKPGPTGGSISAVTLTFKPKYDYSMGDTFSAPADIEIHNKLNTFYYQQYYDESKHRLSYYNNGLMMNFETRYGLLSGNLAALNHHYLPGSAWPSSFYPFIIFKITYDKDYVESINDAENSFKVTRVYPNPAVGTANLEVSLENAANVRVDVLNTLGQLVHSMDDTHFNSGNHQMSFNTSDLKAGVYVLRVVVNGVPTTQSLIIQ